MIDRNLAKSDHWSAYFNCAAFTEGMWNAVCADSLSAGQPYTPENLRNDILVKYGDLAAYNPQIPYDYIVYYGTSLTPVKSLPDFLICWIQHLDFHVIPRYHGCV